MVRLLRRLRDLLGRRGLERDIAEEIRHHLEQEARMLEAAGHSQREARRLARVRFGSQDGTAEDVRAQHGMPWLEDAARDARLAWRVFVQRPGLPVAVALTLALGIGAGTAVFGAIRAVLLEAPGYADPERLAFVWRTDGAGARLRVPGPDAAAVRDGVAGLRDLGFLARVREASLARTDGPAVPLRVATVTVNWFDVLGVEAALGRGFSPADGLTGADAVWLLDGEFFRTRLGADSSLLGGMLELDGRPGTVIGVLPDSYRLLLPPGPDVPDGVDVWEPLRADLTALRRPDRETDQDSDASGIVVVRLAQGAGLASIEPALEAVAGRLREDHASYAAAGWGLEASALHADLVARARPILRAVGGAVLLVLLLAAANATGLLLTRAAARSDELAVRTALGAGRGRIVRQIVIENAVLTSAGAIGGVALATVLLRAARLRLTTLAPGADARMDGTVLIFVVLATLALVAATSAAVLLDPALRPAAGGLLNARGAVTPGRSSRRLRATLVALQVAVSLALVVGATLMVRTAGRLAAQDLGFRATNVLAFRIGLAFPDRYRGPADRAALVSRLESRIMGVPGVEAVGLVGGLPLADPEFTQPWAPDGADASEWGRLRANYRVVTAGYFDAVGTRLLEGRAFRPDDDRQDRRVVIIDAALAARLAADASPIGRTIRVPVDGALVQATVVGVVETVRFESPSEPGRETIYVPYRHEASRRVAFVVRARADARALERPIARAIAAVDPGIAMHDARPLSAIVADALRPARDVMRLLAAFACAAVLLALVALYAAVAWGVHRRRAEIGLRRALGATSRQVIAHAMRTGLAPCAIGLGLGALLVLAGAPALRALVYGVSPLDPVTLVASAAVLAGACTLACHLAARRAARIPPGHALGGDR